MLWGWGFSMEAPEQISYYDKSLVWSYSPNPSVFTLHVDQSNIFALFEFWTGVESDYVIYPGQQHTIKLTGKTARRGFLNKPAFSIVLFLYCREFCHDNMLNYDWYLGAPQWEKATGKPDQNVLLPEARRLFLITIIPPKINKALLSWLDFQW